jgi:hypothetical protein
MRGLNPSLSSGYKTVAPLIGSSATDAVTGAPFVRLAQLLVIHASVLFVLLARGLAWPLSHMK